MTKVHRTLNPMTRRKVAAEVRAHCCNLWNGDKCLMLDDGTEHSCPQLDADSIRCSWFRDAVLPGNPVLEVEVNGGEGMKKCSVCGKGYIPKSNRSIYCPKCSSRVRKQKEAERQRGLRMGHTIRI